MGATAATLPRLLRDAQRRFPGHPAFLQHGVTTTYAGLWQAVLRASNALRALGVRPGDRVALLLENSPDYAIAYYAAIKVGGVAVGLNTALRGPELQRRLVHCAASVLIAAPGHPELDGLVRFHKGLRVVSVTGDLAAHGDETDYDAPAEAHDPAAIIYTSGTTSDPRGVTLSHRNLVANTQSIQAYLRLTEADRIVNVLPFHYSYGNSVLHTHLAAGALIALENSLTYPHLVVQTMVETRATGFSGVPSTYALLLQRVKFRDYDLSALRYLTQAGGAMSPVLATRLREALPKVRLFVMYGQTEATARISYLPPERLDDKPRTVGLGIPGVALEIRDEFDRAVPAGTVGEVCVRGDNVMLGYWDNPDATERVLRDGWLHTGDIGRLDADGFLTLDGRSSDFIKTGAHRVGPIGIEEAIMEIDAVAECAVVGMADEILGEAVAAHVVLKAGAVLDARAVQAHCRSRLAAYMIPKVVTFVCALPRTSSGKVQRFMLKGVGKRA